MSKKILNTVIRMIIIAALLYISFNFYRHTTIAARDMFNFELYKLSILVHFIIFFFVGIVLRFRLSLITAIKKHNVKVNFAKLGLTVILLFGLALVLILYIFIFLYILVVIALIAGVLLVESLEYELK